MPTEALNVSLPEQFRGFVDAQMSRGYYGSASEFIHELFRNEQRRLAEDNPTAFSQAGLESGDAQAWMPERVELLKQTVRASQPTTRASVTSEIRESTRGRLGS
ncbi:MAG: type II toxin-antitoxin system ParD family antitoxin [Burkholderiales bacterium]|nr:type II toxin-antitoxin system ParD family antitoxin [Burkholderiales bacterium]